MSRGRALVVDPGKMTGWGYLDWNTEAGTTDFTGGEMGHDAFIDWSAARLQTGLFVAPDRPIDVIVCEGFTITQRTAKQATDDTQMWSVKQIGHLETWCRWYGLPFVRQMPSDKAFDANGAKLKTLGWWTPAAGVTGEAGHRRDAARHALVYAVNHHLIDLRRLIA